MAGGSEGDGERDDGRTTLLPLLLVAAFALLATAYFVAVRWHAAAARPALVWLLALLPLAALLLGVRTGSRLAVVAAAIELAACIPLHGLLTFIHAWRLD